MNPRQWMFRGVGRGVFLTVGFRHAHLNRTAHVPKGSGPPLARLAKSIPRLFSLSSTEILTSWELKTKRKQNEAKLSYRQLEEIYSSNDKTLLKKFCLFNFCVLQTTLIICLFLRSYWQTNILRITVLLISWLSLIPLNNNYHFILRKFYKIIILCAILNFSFTKSEIWQVC